MLRMRGVRRPAVHLQLPATLDDDAIGHAQMASL